MSNDPNRREARRKKILQNSITRLQKIARINREKANIHDPANTFNDTTTYDADTTQNNTRNQLIQEEEDEDELTSLFERQAVPVHTSSINITFNTNGQRLYFLIFLAVLSKILSNVCTTNTFFIPLTQLDARRVYVDGIFVPVFLYEIAILLLFRNLDTEFSFIHSLLIIGNASLKTASIISYLLNVIIRVIQDLLVYFFLFTVMDLCVHVAHKRAFI